MVPVRLEGVHVDAATRQPVLLLHEREGERTLPIFIGAPEATAIVYAMQGLETPRPLTHDLMVTTLDLLGARIVTVSITNVIDGTYIAEIALDHAGERIRISARPSDAIALAVRIPEVELEVAPNVFDSAGVTIDGQEAAPSEEELQEFREFLNEVRPEDFNPGG